MNKKLLSVVSAFGFVGTAIAASFLGASPIETKASAKSKAVLDDNFNSAAYAGSLNPSVWTDVTSSHSIAQSAHGESYLSAKAKDCGGENIVFTTKNKLSGISSISFDFKFSSGTDRWFSPIFANHSLGESWSTDYAYAGMALFNKDHAAGLGGTLSSQFDFSSVLGTSADATWISAKIEVSGANNATLNFAVKGQAFNASNAVTVSYNKLSSDMTSAYFGIVVETKDGQIDFDNFSIVYGEGTLNQDFTDFDFEEDDNWGFFKKAGQKNNWFLSDSSALCFNDAISGDYIYSNNAIVTDTSIVDDVEVVRLSFFVKFLSSSSAEKLALVFGVDSSASPLDVANNVARYEIDKSGATLVQYQNGVAVSSVRHLFSSIATAVGSNITMTISKKGAVSILENGSSVLNEEGGSADMGLISTYSGNIAILALTPINQTIEFDNIKLVNTTYYVPVTKSVTHNFSNNFFGNKGHEDFLCVDGDGGGVTTVKDGKLVWDRATDGTFFGSAHQYDAFVLDFKLCDIDVSSTDLTKWIGLDLSKENRYSGAYGSYGMLLTQITPEGTSDYSPALWKDDYVSTLDMTTLKIIQHKQIPADYFKPIQYTSTIEEANISEGDAICFRYVSDGSNLKFYLKKAKEANFELYTEVKGLELNGYFAICCTGFTYCKFDDFSMANTSSIYTVADNEKPETITETETVVIYDNNNVDVNLDKELSLNAVSPALTITLGVLAGVGILGSGVLAYFLIRKKGGKHEKEE